MQTNAFDNDNLIVSSEELCPLCSVSLVEIDIIERDDNGLPTENGIEVRCHNENTHDRLPTYEDVLTFHGRAYRYCLETISLSRRWELALFGQSQLPILDWEDETCIPQSPFYLKTWEAAYAAC